MSSDDVVIINDDNQKDSDIEVIDVSKENRTDNDAIIIDDDIIEIIDVDAIRSNKDIKDYLTRVCSQNRLVGEFIEKCLDLEQSDGMLRVIYRTFLPLYNKMEDGYRDSDDFKKAVDMTMRALEVNPNLKFTHLKFVCDIMKSKGKDKKRVQLTTLSSNVTANPTKPVKRRKRRKRRCKLTSVKKSKKRRTENVIDLDGSSDEGDKREPPALCPETDDVVVLEDNTISSNKEVRIPEPSTAPSVQDSDIDVARANNLNNQPMAPVSEALRLPSQPGTCIDETSDKQKKEETIKQIEKEIEYYKSVVDKLEQEEVKTDSFDSPYIQCERVKATIVLLYKELCSLTGDVPVKKRKIHFSATDGRPQLPLLFLEAFINENIGPDGNPCLPDFCDVEDCVSRANEYGGLGWDKARIWNEARALFTFCGQALQDSRKKREWRYMLSLANSQIDNDPAERDPELMARLDANRRIAVKKELDLLEQYVKLEEGRCYGDSIQNDFQVSQDQDSDDEFEETTLAASTSYPNNRNQVTSTTVTNNFYSCRTENVPLNKNNMGFIIGSTIYRAFEQRFGNNHVQDIALNRSHNNLNNNTDTRMLEISVGCNQNPEVRVVTVNNTNEIQNQNFACLQANNQAVRTIEVSVENNKPPSVEVINAASSDHSNKGNVVQDTVIDTSTCIIEFDNSINEKFKESFEDTYKDFVQNRAIENFTKNNNKSIVTSEKRRIPLVTKDVYSIGTYPNGPCNSINNYSENMPLVIKEVYSVATKQINNTQNNSDNSNRDKGNLVELGNKSLLFNEVSTKLNDPSTQIKNSGLGKDSSVESKNMSIMIKDVYSVETKQNTSIGINRSRLDNSDATGNVMPRGKPQEIMSGEASTIKENVIAESQNDATTANTNPEQPKSDIEEENSIKVKTEVVSDLLKEMENFGDSFSATVFDIEDPFLVIEISDSSDESDHEKVRQLSL